MASPAIATLKYSRVIERRLLEVYHRANMLDSQEGLSWYQEAHNTALKLSEKYGVTLKQSCGVIAALSPGRSWEMNIDDANEFIGSWAGGKRGRKLPVVGSYGRRNVQKCIRILEGEQPLDVLGGNKVRAFYSNILNPANESPVTIDRHAKCAAYGIKNSDNSVVKDSEYEFLAEHYRVCASKVDLVPCQFQAICWVTWRRLNGNINQLDLVADNGTPDWVTNGLGVAA